MHSGQITRRRGVLLGAIAAALLGCGVETPSLSTHPGALSTDPIGLADATNQFGLDLMGKLSRETTENVLVSPFSAALALTMTGTGAEGQTRDAILSTLHQDGRDPLALAGAYGRLLSGLRDADPTIELDIANSIWHRTELAVRQDFIEENRSTLEAEVSALDFARPDASAIINQWVAKKTHNKINQIVDNPMDPSKYMLLINALYFKGDWSSRFARGETVDGAFQSARGEELSVPMMRRKGMMAYGETRDYQAVSLPYGNGAFSFALILPADGVNLDAFLSSLTPESWRAIQEKLEPQSGILMLPRFTVQYDRSLADVLRAEGMGVAFTPQADFSGMVEDGGGLYIGDVKHKTFAEVNEEGTEAAAVTSVEMVRSMALVPQYTMNVNRPFLFAIQDNETHTLLFLGKVSRPAEAK